jgi:hypothetical protein
MMQIHEYSNNEKKQFLGKKCKIFTTKIEVFLQYSVFTW